MMSIGGREVQATGQPSRKRARPRKDIQSPRSIIRPPKSGSV